MFDIAIMRTPRTRAWMFSSVTSRGRPSKTGASAPSQRGDDVRDADRLKRIPRFSASRRASSRECCDEISEGSETPITFWGPNAAAAIVPTTAESIPPESATSAVRNPPSARSRAGRA